MNTLPAALLKSSFDHAQAQEEFKLRDYQQQVITELKELYRKGFTKPFVYAPTGAGKMVIAATLIKQAVSKGNKCLFLVHRDTLVEQMLETLAKYGIEAGVIKSGYKEQRSHLVQIVGVQSLNSRELPEGVKLVLVDEAHSCPFYTNYGLIKQAYPNAFYVGFTATPWRSKPDEYMGQHFDSIVRCPSVGELITQGYLSPPRYFGFGGLLDLTELDYSDGDYNQKQVQKLTLTNAYNEVVVSKWYEMASTRKTVFFCAGVEQSKKISGMLAALNITSTHIDAATPLPDRKLIYERLRKGEIQTLASVGVLVEGFDIASIDCVVLARPTRSRALLFQACGRGLRISAGKKDCWLLDFGENFQRLGYLTDKQPIQLEPIKNKNDIDTPLKQCPECNQLVLIATKICPYCGHEFVNSDDSDQNNKSKQEQFENEFGELFPEDQKQKIRWLRNLLRRQYKTKKSIDQVWEKFKTKWGHYQPNQWHIGAIFIGDNCEANKQIFLRYLLEVNPHAKQDWIDFHIMMEFGNEKNKKQEKKKRNYQRPEPATQPQNWWDILGVNSWCIYEEAKLAYRQQAMKCHPDLHQSENNNLENENKMKLLNLAWELAMKHFNK